MARNSKEVGVRVSVKDDGARRAFKDLGTDGQRALSAIAREGRETNIILRDLNASANSVRAAFDGMQRIKGGVAGLLGGLVANATVQQVRDVARGLAEIGDSAKRAGLGLEAFQELKFVAEQNRIGVDQLVDGIKELNLRADEFVTTGGGSAAEAFQRLGYNAERLREKLKDPSALFSEIIGKLQLLDRAGQIRVLDEIFGGSAGEQFVQLIEQGEAGIKRAIEEAHALGAVMSQDLVDKADDLDRKFQKIETTVSNGLKAAVVEAANALAIFLDQFQSIEDREFVRPLQNQLAELYNERAAVADRIRETQDALASGAPNAQVLKLDLQELGVEFETLTAQADQLLARITELQGRGTTSAISPPKIDLPGGGADWGDFTKTFTPPKQRSGGGRDNSAREAERERQKIEGVIQALRDELALIGASDAEREVMNQLRRAGVDAASAEGQTIRGLVEQLSREEAAINRLEDAMDDLGDTARGVLGSIVSGLREGKSAADIAADAMDNLISKMLSSGIDMGVGALTKWLTGLFSPAATGGVWGNGLWGSAIFGQAHSGWQVGRGNPPQSRSLASLPRMHMGGLNRDEQLIVARQDESIFTPRQMDNADGLVTALMRNLSHARQNGGASVRVEVHNHSGEKVSEESSTGPDGTQIQKIIIGEVASAVAEGRLDSVLGSTYGLKRRGLG